MSKRFYFIGLLGAIVGLLVIFTTVISDKELNCQNELIFLLANNTETFYRSLLFSNSHITASLFSHYFNETNNELDSLGNTFNLLQDQTRRFDEDVSKITERCSNFRIIKNTLYILEVILSFLIVFITLSTKDKKK